MADLHHALRVRHETDRPQEFRGDPRGDRNGLATGPLDRCSPQPPLIPTFGLVQISQPSQIPYRRGVNFDRDLELNLEVLPHV